MVENSQVLHTYYFKVWNGNQITKKGLALTADLKKEREKLRQERAKLLRQGCSFNRYKTVENKIMQLNATINTSNQKNKEPKTWYVIFNAHTINGAQARLLRCLFGGKLTRSQGYKICTKEEYSNGLNPEKDATGVKQLLNIRQ